MQLSKRQLMKVDNETGMEEKRVPCELTHIQAHAGTHTRVDLSTTKSVSCDLSQLTNKKEMGVLTFTLVSRIKGGAE